MQKYMIGAAFAVAAIFLGLALIGQASGAVEPPDAAVYAVDPSAVQPGADSVLRPPMPALGSEYATPTAQALDGAVEVPWGDWLAMVLQGLIAAVGAGVIWAFRKLPASVVSGLDALAGLLNQGRADALLEKAVTYGINTTAGAVKGKSMSLKVGNEVLERGFEYALDKAPMFVRFVLGLVNVRAMIIARLDLDEDAALPATRGVADSLAERPTVPAPAPPPIRASKSPP